MKDNAVANGILKGLVLVAVAQPALAHHSFAAFDMMKQAEIKGTVKEFLWTNPHCVLSVNTKDAAGAPVLAFIEMNGPGYLVRNGWKRESLKPGDEIAATVHPMRDSSPGGDLVKIRLADGRELSAAITLNLTPGAKL